MNDEYFEDIHEDYVYLQEDFDKYFDKTDRPFLAMRRLLGSGWNKAANDIYTDCLFFYELFSHNSFNENIKVANKSERFSNLTFAYPVTDEQSRYLLSYADEFIDLEALVDLCIVETERFKLYEEYKNLHFRMLGKDKTTDAFVCHFLYEQDLFDANYTFTTVVKQARVGNAFLHAVVNVRNKICAIVVFIGSKAFLCDYSDYFSQVDEESDKQRKYYFLEQVDKDYTFYSSSDTWITPQETHKSVTSALYREFNIFEKELLAEIPEAQTAQTSSSKTAVIKF